MGFPTVAEAITNPDSLKELFGLNPSLIGDIPVDLVLSYTPGFSAEITRHPVESGFNVTDARIIAPDFLTMECVFTDPEYSGINIAKQALSGTLGASLTTSWRDKRDRLYALANGDDVLTVVTPSASLDSMLISDIRPEITSSTSGAFFFTIDFEKVRIVDSEISLIDEKMIPKEVREKEAAADAANPEDATKRDNAKKRKKPESGKGKNQGEAATTKQESILSGLLGFGG